MNMHGIIKPIETSDEENPSRLRKIIGWFWKQRYFTFIVLAPSLLVAIYLFVFASDQYEAEAHFLVRGVNSAPAPTSGLSEVLSLTGAGDGGGQNESMSVADYLTSSNAVQELRANDQLVERFQRPSIDLFDRLGSKSPSPERLLRYYRKQVTIKYDTETGITSLVVHSFRPQDSYDLARNLLDLGEKRVNTMNERSYTDAVSMARKQLVEAENAVTASQLRMTDFRQTRRDIDPKASGEAQLTLVANLNEQLATARAQLNAMRGTLSPNSPQLVALSGRVAALSAQIAAQSNLLAGSPTAIAADIGGYEGLKLREEFLSKQYEAAAASLDRAREEAQRQQLYVVRVVEPVMPVKALYPQRMQILATVVISLLLSYSIGWLIVAGVREHAA
jgi:capsular polysaccharide transport system permease protein